MTARISPAAADRISTAAAVTAAAAIASRMPRRESDDSTLRCTSTTAANCVSVNTHSDINVDVARKTKAGTRAVATAIPPANAGGCWRCTRRYRKVRTPTPIIAAIDTLFSSGTFWGKSELARNISERSAGNPGGYRGRIATDGELMSL